MWLFLALVFLASFFAMAVLSKKGTSAGSKQAQREKAAQAIAADFRRVGWSMWNYSVHLNHDQIKRMGRSTSSEKMRLLSYDSQTHVAIVLGDTGKEYRIDEHGCSCPDCTMRGLPCKHMYFAVAELTEDK